MPVHVEFDFNDDGTVTMTHKQAPGGEIVKTALARVLAGADDSHSHTVWIGTKQHLSRDRFLDALEWAS